MKSILIKDGRIIDPKQKIDKIGSLLVEDSKISKLSLDKPTTPEPGVTIIDAKGLIVSPGFIDLHCHLRDPGFTQKETIATGTKAASKGGFTTVCCMPNTNPPIDSRQSVDYVKQTALSQGAARVLPIGCITGGREGKALGELEELAKAGVIGFSDDGSPVMDSGIMRQALSLNCATSLPVMEHCEDLNLARGGQMNEGAMSRKLGLSGIPPAAEDVMVFRNLLLAELTGGWIHICHASTAGSVELIKWAKEKGIRVTAEATPHHLVLDETSVGNANPDAKVNPPLRTAKDVQALVKGLKEGAIDVIATDHAPHAPSEKAQGFSLAPSGISAFETALGMLMSLVHNGSLTLNELIAKLTLEPARILGKRFNNIGTLAPGSEADITIFDPDKEWVVNANEFVSKGHNTPVDGMTLKGRVLGTIYAGQLVHRDSLLKLEVG